MGVRVLVWWLWGEVLVMREVWVQEQVVVWGSRVVREREWVVLEAKVWKKVEMRTARRTMCRWC